MESVKRFFSERGLLIGHGRAGVERNGLGANSSFEKGAVCRSGASADIRAPQVEVYASPKVRNRDQGCSVESPRPPLPKDHCSCPG